MSLENGLRDAGEDWPAISPRTSNKLQRDIRHLLLGGIGFTVGWALAEQHYNVFLVWVVAVASEVLCVAVAFRCLQPGRISRRLGNIAVGVSLAGIGMALAPVWGFHIGESAVSGAQNYHRHMLIDIGHQH